MLVGNQLIFAIESGITQVFQRLSQRALGYFVIYVVGRIFGVRAPEATMLACSFDSVNQRLSRRGCHCVSFGVEASATAIAEAFRATTYDEDRPGATFFGLSADEFRDVTTTNGIVWAPDGDEAFDDGSHVLQFDVGDKVRLIAFINEGNKEATASTVVEVWLGADEYYEILEQWQASFEVEREAALASS